MWTDEQKSAIEKRNSNILVSASAGSGKTTVLISRVIKRVLEEEIDIDKILVVTFTNAAAMKLKDDLLKRLKEEYSKKSLKRSFIKKQINLLNKANISTIHSFCLNLIRANFDVLAIDPEFKVCDESKIRMYKAKALNEVLEEEYANEDNELLFMMLQLFNYKEDEMCQELLKIYDYIQSFERPFEWLKENIDKYNVNESIDNLCENEFGRTIYEETMKELSLISARINSNIEKLQNYDDFEKIVDLLRLDQSLLEDIIVNSNNNWDALYSKLNDINFKRFPRYNGENLLKNEEIQNFRKNVIKDKINKLKDTIYADTKTIVNDNKIAFKYLMYIYDILCSFDRKYKDIKLSKNVIDFADIEHLAYDLLIKDGKNTEIAKNLKAKFKEVYTDEYQDTSCIQEAILDIVSCSNNRFMVGDIKQSIYRFRQASPEIFNHKSSIYNVYNGDNNSLENTKIILAKNFRSRPEVIDFVNLIFKKIMTMEAGNSDYSGDEVLKCGKEEIDREDFYNTEINIIDLKKSEEYEEGLEDEENLIDELKDFEIESRFIAKNIKKLVEGPSKKGIEYKDIVILLRSVTNRADILEDVLKSENIPVFSDVSSSIFDSEEVRLILSFLRIIDNKYQDVYLVSIMYSIIGNFTLDELIEIRNIDKKCYLYDSLIKFIEESSNKNLVKKVENFLSLIRSYESSIKSLTLSEILIKLYNTTGIYYQFILDENYKQRKANLDLILDLTLKYENEYGSFLNEYIEYIDNLSSKADASSMQAKIIGENENVVRIMTIHKSKGLEFPVVILADTSRKYNSNDFKNKIYLHQNFGVGINIVDSMYKVSYPSLIKSTIKKQLENEMKSEELRLLYVALTRAKNKLIIYGTVKDYFKLKSDMLVIKEKEKIDSYTVLKNDSYLKNIILALEDVAEDEKKLYDITIIKVEDGTECLVSKEEKDDILDAINFNAKDFSKDDIENRIKEIEDKMLEKLIESQDKDIMQRVSVTRLKQGEENIVPKLEQLIPSCLSESSEKITPARKGTLIHFILQILDFNKILNKSDLISFIDKKEQEHVITSAEKKYINIEDIMRFLNSDICSQVRNSIIVEKEKEFILKDNSFTNSTIQGVIDLYYEIESGKIILVDFKTDNISDEKVFAELYKKQLDIYKEAIEKLEHKQVVKKYIYSFKLGKKIEVN